MSLLTRSAPPDGAAPTAAPLASPLAVGALAAVQALVGSLLCVVAPVLAVWIASTRTDATWSEALRIAADAWLLAHHTGIAVDGGHVALIPLGLTLLPAAWCWAGGRRISAALGTTAPRGTRRRALAAFAAVYALAAAVVSLLAASPVARPLSGQALLGAGVLAATAAGLALLRGPETVGRRSGVRDVLARLAARLPLPPVVRRVLPAACVAVAAWLAAGAVVLVAALAVHWEGVLAAHGALAAGPVGGLGLTLAQLALMPVAVIWAAAWAAGPGFAVGAGTVVNPWVADLGALPALPLLAALPNGALPGPVQAVLVVPVLAGALAGWWLRRHRPPAGWRCSVRSRGWSVS